MKKRKRKSSTVSLNVTGGIEAFHHYNVWDVLLGKHDMIKTIIEFLSFPNTSINNSMVKVISVNKKTRDYIFKCFLDKISVNNENKLNFLIRMIEKKKNHEPYIIHRQATRTKFLRQDHIPIKILSWRTEVKVLSNILKRATHGSFTMLVNVKS